MFGNNQVSDYAPGGVLPRRSHSARAAICCGLSFGAAVNATSDRFYVTDFYGGTVEIFDPGPNLPGVTTEGAINPGNTSGTLTGHRRPRRRWRSHRLPLRIRHRHLLQLRQPSPVNRLLRIASPTGVHADLSGLTSRDHLPLSPESSATPVDPTQARIAPYTPHAVIGLATEPATNVTRTTAQLNGSFVGNGEDTHYYFEWGTDQSYGHTTTAPPGVDAGSGSGPTPAAANLSELTPQTDLSLSGRRSQRRRDELRRRSEVPDTSGRGQGADRIRHQRHPHRRPAQRLLLG